MKRKDINTHTLGVYVVNRPGVLARIAQVFSRRAFNIDSLVVSPSQDGHFSRMTITAQGDADNLGQVLAAVNKLVDVLHCIDHTEEFAVVKELALIKVAVSAEERTAILQIIEHFEAKTVDFTPTSMIIMVTGNSDKLDSMIDLVRAYEIVELVRTGKVLMARGEKET